MSIILTDEQEKFIEKALNGKNILVDACVGSGKTTAIQALCTRFPKNKKILYLTYNKLLKIDAKEKIKGRNVTVTNYHGYAWSCLNRIGMQVGVSDLLQEFNKKKPPVRKFDLIVLDEYQDIDQEIADMLDYIVSCNPEAQLVAASRGKKQIIFVPGNEEILSEESISTPEDMNTSLENVRISEMFDFKFQEDIEECYDLLEKKKINMEDSSVIDIRSNDGLIDLSPCIGIFQEAFFFDNYDIDREFKLFRLVHKDRKIFNDKIKGVEKKILYLTSLETNQRRYYSQVSLPLVTDEQKELLTRRIETRLRHDEEEQIICSIAFAERRNGEKAFEALGYADVKKDDTIYELKFVSQLNHEHYLQCACYMIAQNLDKGILWNIRTNEMWEISIPDKQKFMESVVKTITKRQLTKYYKPKGK